MKRFEAIKKIRSLVNDEVIVSNIGDPSKELFAAGDRDENFYMLGSMGLASSIGLGISLANERKVIVLDGDGSILMNLGSLVTIASCAPANYKLIVLDNGAYGSTGYQDTSFSKVGSLHDIALSSGNRDVRTVSTIEELEEAVKEALSQDRCFIIIAKVTREHERFPIVKLEAERIKERFIKCISKSKKSK